MFLDWTRTLVSQDWTWAEAWADLGPALGRLSGGRRAASGRSAGGGRSAVGSEMMLSKLVLNQQVLEMPLRLGSSFLVGLAAEAGVAAPNSIDFELHSHFQWSGPGWS